MAHNWALGLHITVKNYKKLLLGLFWQILILNLAIFGFSIILTVQLYWALSVIEWTVCLYLLVSTTKHFYPENLAVLNWTNYGSSFKLDCDSFEEQKTHIDNKCNLMVHSDLVRYNKHTIMPPSVSCNHRAEQSGGWAGFGGRRGGGEQG